MLTDEEEAIVFAILEQINAELDEIAAFIESQYQNSTKEEPMKIPYKKLTPDAVEPRKATVGAAGFDMTATWFEKTENGNWKYHTGIAIELPHAWTALAFPRSSIVKKNAILGNSVGIIDSDYRGEITFVFRSVDGKPPYKAQERIGQLILVPVPYAEMQEAEELSETERGAGGYGSTGA